MSRRPGREEERCSVPYLLPVTPAAMANGDANAIPIFIVRVRVDRLSAFWDLALLPPLQNAVPVAASSCSPGGGGGDRRTDRCGLSRSVGWSSEDEMHPNVSQNTPELGQFKSGSQSFCPPLKAPFG
jgi:hypothetical protein